MRKKTDKHNQQQEHTSKLNAIQGKNHLSAIQIKHQYKMRKMKIQQQINKLREIAIKCAQNKNVQSIILQLSQKIVNLAKYASQKLNHDNYLRYLIHQDNPQDYAGSIPYDQSFLHTTVSPEGNIREQMRIILNFAQNSCKIIQLLIHQADKNIDINQLNNLGISIQDLNRRKNIIEKYIGASYSQIFALNDKDGSSILLQNEGYFKDYCLLSQYSKQGPVFLNMFIKQPIMYQNRQMPNYKKDQQAIQIKDIYPQLSARELQVLQKVENHNFQEPNARLPWVTKFRKYDLREENPFIQLARLPQYHKFSISGPSEEADLLLDLGLLFNVSPKSLILAIISYLGQLSDNSLHEILIAGSAEPFNIGYQINNDEYQFVQQLLDQV